MFLGEYIEDAETKIEGMKVESKVYPLYNQDQKDIRNNQETV